VRQSKLDVVPSLALGTSPVTLKEMVSAYGTIANSGSYIEPFLITQVEDRNGKVLERFAALAPELAMSMPSAQVLLDVLRGAIDRGTGTGIRSRFGIQADVAGKTGTTQDNTDGWFVLMHSQLVAGAWVGFNDNRVTMGNRWGPGAQSALPMVGEFFQQVIKAKVLDPGVKFSATAGISQVPAPFAEENAALLAAPPSALPDAGLTPLNSGVVGSPAPSSGVMSPPPIKYMNIQIHPAVPMPVQAGAPTTDALLREAESPRRVEQLPTERQPSFPLSEMPAPNTSNAR